MEHVHFIGIGGVGMSGLAQVLLARGSRVSGSDPSANEATARLEKAGAVIYGCQDAANIARERPDLVVVTAAIPPDNAELAAARQAGIEVVSRAEYLGRVMASHGGVRIAVTGTHGKTTTTSMAAQVLMDGGVDPTVLVGGEYAPMGGNTRVGAGSVFLTEACEAYSSFLSLHPDIAVVTNVDVDHLDHYGTQEAIFQAFEEFVGNISAHGALIWCSEDTGATDLVENRLGGRALRRSISYGFAPRGAASVWARDVRVLPGGTTFSLQRSPGNGDAALGPVRLRVPGEHNVLNALAAAAIGLELGLCPASIIGSLEAFAGTERRYDHLGEVDGVTVIDDYAHHPAEIRATLAAARASYPDRRLVVVFQPHLYSRTRDFLDEFAEALSEADAVLVADVYAARERPAEDVGPRDIVKRVRLRAPHITALCAGGVADVAGVLWEVTLPDDVVIVMGAGDIRAAGEAFLAGGAQGPGGEQQR